MNTTEAFRGPERRHRIEPVDIPFSTYRMGLAVFFPMILLMGAILGIKQTQLGPLTVSGGAFIFPWTFGILTIMSEVYGLRAGTKLAQMGGLMLLTASVLLFIVVKLPTAHVALHRSREFMDLFGAGAVPLLLTNLALAIGFSATLLCLAFFLRRTHGRVLWLRVWLAPTAGQVAAPLIVIPLALAEAHTSAFTVLQAEASRALISVLYGTLMAPFLAWIIFWIREADLPHSLPVDPVTESLRGHEGSE